jgi:hypothetical protein
MSSARDKHETLLVQLHREMKEGRGNGDRADAIGDEMNELWAALDDVERELFDELSEDLYLIEGKRRVVPLDEGETVASVRKQMATALDEHRDRETLALARKLRDAGPELTYVIGRCWARLGFPLGATCFFDFAEQQVEAQLDLARAQPDPRITARFRRTAGKPLPGRQGRDDSYALRPAA